MVKENLLSWHVNDLLDHITIKKGTNVGSFAFGSISDTISKLVPLVESISEQKQVECVWEVSSIQGIFLKFDKQRLQQVILNLVWNGIKSSEH